MFLLKYEDAGFLRLKQGDSWIAVQVKQCFPWLKPNEYLGLLNEKQEELAMIEKVEDLDEKSQQALKAYMKHVNFKIEIFQIYRVEEEYELRVWEVETNLGRRKVYTSIKDWPSNTPDGSIKIEDLQGDLYLIRSPRSLDRKSQSSLSNYADF